MKRFLIAATALIAISGALQAHEFKQGDLVISHPWTRATPGGATVGAGYVAITNTGKAPDTLTGGTFENAERVEIHEMKMDGDTMRMRHLEQGLEIKPGETVKFTPGSYHLMFVGLKAPITQGHDVKGSLTFAKAGSVAVDYKVEAIGATTSSDAANGDAKGEPSDAHHDHSGHGDH